MLRGRHSRDIDLGGVLAKRELWDEGVSKRVNYQVNDIGMAAVTVYRCRHVFDVDRACDQVEWLDRHAR